MYGAYHAPDCGDCESAGLGLYIPLESKDAGYLNGDDAGGSFATSADDWWREPLSTISTAVAERIGGATSPYSPGTYPYGDTGYTTPPQAPAADPYASAPPAGVSPATMLLWAVIGIGGLKLAGVF